jgi:CRISPR-associated protein Csb2
MSQLLCISVRFLQPFAHGRGDTQVPEWPPSPLRLLQALVAASAGRWNQRTRVLTAEPALRWLEALPPPTIVAPEVHTSQHPCRFYVPDNVADRVAASWRRGGTAEIADYRTEKDVHTAHLLDGDAVHYLYPLTGTPPTDWQPHVQTLTLAARAMTHLGWGIDMATGDAEILPAHQARQLPGHRWVPCPAGGTPLRVAQPGTLNELARKHTDFLGRLAAGVFHPVPPLRVFGIVRYQREDHPLSRPCRLFKLLKSDGRPDAYPHAQLIHLAGMLRHLAIGAMLRDPPPGVSADWVETCVAGHRHNSDESALHRQFSYLPLPSLGHRHTDPAVRRVMIAAPLRDEALLDHLARRLAGLTLRPEPGKPDRFCGQPPILVPLRHGDNVTRCYTRPSSVWHSFTPVILPGHDDHRSAKTQALIAKALAQSGIDQPCDFEWSAVSRFPKSYTSHKCGPDQKLQGYIRPDHLLTQTAVHLTLRFHDGSAAKNPVAVPGPLAVGAGRHCGLGLLAAGQEDQ